MFQAAQISQCGGFLLLVDELYLGGWIWLKYIVSCEGFKSFRKEPMLGPTKAGFIWHLFIQYQQKKRCLKFPRRFRIKLKSWKKKDILLMEEIPAPPVRYVYIYIIIISMCRVTLYCLVCRDFCVHQHVFPTSGFDHGFGEWMSHGFPTGLIIWHQPKQHKLKFIKSLIKFHHTFA